jgi:DNA repair exonuclease SbcCD ATPase subunit
MRLASIAVEGFRGFVEPVELDLAADVVILHGPNGAGKTSLMDAILWGLTGHVERVEEKGSPVSLYAREGIARVELGLGAPDQGVRVVRVSNGKETSSRLHIGDAEFDGAAGEARLANLLLPHLKDRASATQALSDVLTRGVYLQQDLVRQFIEADSAADRFSVLSEVIGAGEVLELQQALEKSRNQWSRSTGALRKETLEPLETRLAQISEQLSRVDELAEVGSVDARAAGDDLYRRALGLLGAGRLSVTEPPTTSSALDRLLRELSAELSRVEREIATLSALRQEMAELANTPKADVDQLTSLESRAAELATDLSQLDERIADIVARIAEQQRRQIEDANRLNRAASLASLALDGLTDVCPVCQQKHDINKTREHLEHLIALASGKPDHGLEDESLLAELNSRRAELRVEAEQSRARLDQERRAANELGARRSNLTTRLADLGVQEVSPAGLDARVERLGGAARTLRELIRSGERLTLTVVRLGEQRRRAELTQESAALREKIEAAKAQVLAQERTHALAGRIIEALRGAALDVTRKQVENIAPLFQRIYSRIDPHPTFKVTQVLAQTRGGKGQLMVGVSDPDQGEAAHEAGPILSSSQLNSFAVSLFLALNLAVPSLRLAVTMLDDPLQSLDSINLLGLIDVLRRFREHRQIFVSTHEDRLLGLLQRKLRPVRTGEKLTTITFGDWTKSGPSLRANSAEFAPDQARVLAVA